MTFWILLVLCDYCGFMDSAIECSKPKLKLLLMNNKQPQDEQEMSELHICPSWGFSLGREICLSKHNKKDVHTTQYTITFRDKKESFVSTNLSVILINVMSHVKRMGFSCSGKYVLKNIATKQPYCEML